MRAFETIVSPRQPQRPRTCLLLAWLALTACTPLHPLEGLEDAGTRSDRASTAGAQAPEESADVLSPEDRAAPPNNPTADASVGSAGAQSMEPMRDQLDAGDAGPAPAGASAGGAGGSGTASSAPPPAYGEPCNEPGVSACTAMYPKYILRCDEARWILKICGGEIDGYCEPSSGPERAECIFLDAEQCAGLAPNARVCIGAEVHACDGDRTRLLEECKGDKPLCDDGVCSCINGVCPERLATAMGLVRRIALAGSYLYWIEDGARTIGRVPHTGGNATPVVTRSVELTSLIADDRNLYWIESESSTVMKAALDGTAVMPVVSGLIRPQGLALDADHVYWISDETNPRHVARAAKSGGAITTISSIADAVSILVTGGYVYIGGSSELTRVLVDGGTPMPLTTMANSAVAASKLATDTRNLYFRASNSFLTANNQIVIGSVPLAGGSVSLVESAPIGDAMAVDDRHVYFAHTGRMLRRNHDGSSLLVLFDSGSNVQVADIQLDAEWIYFSADQAIYRLRKD
jgi:hypothetical protein